MLFSTCECGRHVSGNAGFTSAKDFPDVGTSLVYSQVDIEKEKRGRKFFLRATVPKVNSYHVGMPAVISLSIADHRAHGKLDCG